MAKQHQIPQPTPTPCPECGALRVAAEALNTMRLMETGTKLPGIDGKVTEMWALVCPHCGHTTLYAKDPDKLADQSR